MSQASSNGDDSKSTFWKQIFDIKNTIAAVTLQITSRVLQNAAQIDDIQQHRRRNCLIFHGLEDIPKPKRNPQNESETLHLTYMDFEKYMVNKINSLNLRIKISGKDIDTAHPLKTGSGKTLMIVKFARRNVKHIVYASKKHLKDQDLKLSITEALTTKRLKLVKLAEEKFGKKSVGSIEGKVFVYIGDTRKYICNEEEIYNLQKWLGFSCKYLRITQQFS